MPWVITFNWIFKCFICIISCTKYNAMINNTNDGVIYYTSLRCRKIDDDIFSVLSVNQFVYVSYRFRHYNEYDLLHIFKRSYTNVLLFALHQVCRIAHYFRLLFYSVRITHRIRLMYECSKYTHVYNINYTRIYCRNNE